jgi:hypothetical protein
MDQAELVFAIRGLSFADWVYLVCSVPGALGHVGIGGLLFPAIGLSFLIDYVTGKSPSSPGLVGLAEVYDRCFTDRPDRRVRHWFKDLFKTRPRLAWSSVVGAIALTIAIGIAWSYLTTGSDFPDFYDQLGLWAKSDDAKIAKKIAAYLEERVRWNGIVTETTDVAGRVVFFRVKPVGREGLPLSSQQVSVYPQKRVESTFFARLPQKVRLRGQIANIDRKKGVTIRGTDVVKLE